MNVAFALVILAGAAPRVLDRSEHPRVISELEASEKAIRRAMEDVSAEITIEHYRNDEEWLETPVVERQEYKSRQGGHVSIFIDRVAEGRDRAYVVTPDFNFEVIRDGNRPFALNRVSPARGGDADLTRRDCEALAFPTHIFSDRLVDFFRMPDIAIDKIEEGNEDGMPTLVVQVANNLGGEPRRDEYDFIRWKDIWLQREFSWRLPGGKGTKRFVRRATYDFSTPGPVPVIKEIVSIAGLPPRRYCRWIVKRMAFEAPAKAEFAFAAYGIDDEGRIEFGRLRHVESQAPYYLGICGASFILAGLGLRWRQRRASD